MTFYSERARWPLERAPWPLSSTQVLRLRPTAQQQWQSHTGTRRSAEQKLSVWLHFICMAEFHVLLRLTNCTACLFVCCGFYCWREAKDKFLVLVRDLTFVAQLQFVRGKGFCPDNYVHVEYVFLSFKNKKENALFSDDYAELTHVLENSWSGPSSTANPAASRRPVLIGTPQNEVKRGGAPHTADQIAESKGRQNEMGRV